MLRDLGGANLALAAVILFAIARPTRELVRAVAAAVLVAQVPHFIYHAAHLDLMPTSLDRVMQTVALTLTLVIPLLVLMRSSGMREERESAGRSICGNEHEPSGKTGITAGHIAARRASDCDGRKRMSSAPEGGVAESRSSQAHRDEPRSFIPFTCRMTPFPCTANCAAGFPACQGPFRHTIVSRGTSA